MLVAAVVGSGIMATGLTSDTGVQLLINMFSTVLALGVLIWTLGPISGAHFNPAVTLVALVQREIGGPEALGYLVAQVAGAISGAMLADVMFGIPISASGTQRGGAGVLIGEVVATTGLIWVVGALTRTGKGHLGPMLVPAWIGAAYFFTSSTSFANPAVTVGRAFSDSFAGIAPGSVPPFIAAQLVGAAIGAGLTVMFHVGSAQPPDLPNPVHARKESR